MFTFIAELFENLSKGRTRQNELDAFISSKNPGTPSEVDYWAREFDRRQHRSLI